MSSLCGIIGFSSGFWKLPDVTGSILLWAKAVLPATYPFFIASTVLSTIVLRLILREAQAAMKAAHQQVLAEGQTQSIIRYSKISNGCVVNCTAEEATITCFINPDLPLKQFMTNNLQIDIHTLQSCFDPNELSRFELQQDHFSLVMKLPQMYRAEDTFIFKVTSCST